jgi:hypothetical protein
MNLSILFGPFAVFIAPGEERTKRHIRHFLARIFFHEPRSANLITVPLGSCALPSSDTAIGRVSESPSPSFSALCSSFGFSFTSFSGTRRKSEKVRLNRLQIEHKPTGGVSRGCSCSAFQEVLATVMPQRSLMWVSLPALDSGGDLGRLPALLASGT